MEATERLARAGWREDETQRLLSEVRLAGEKNIPLCTVFEKLGEALGRKPNSVRNYYYMRLRAGDLPCERRAAPFRTFSEDEVRELVREVEKGRAAGESVRACVCRLAGGDRALMLRYQNKYRSVRKKRPELIAEITDGSRTRVMRDPDVRALYEGLERLIRRAGMLESEAPPRDTLRVERDLLLLRAEDLQRAAGELVLQCKQLLAMPEPERFMRLDGQLASLARCVSAVENAFM